MEFVRERIWMVHSPGWRNELYYTLIQLEANIYAIDAGSLLRPFSGSFRG